MLTILKPWHQGGGQGPKMGWSTLEEKKTLLYVLVRTLMLDRFWTRHWTRPFRFGV